MPLPLIKVLCSAHSKRTKLPCRNPAAFGCSTCRMHGAHKRIVSGESHHWFVHGERSKLEQNKAREVGRLLAFIEDISYKTGIMIGPKSRGRKPG